MVGYEGEAVNLHPTARSTGRNSPFYGKLHIVQNPEAAAIWHSRHKEPEPCFLPWDWLVEDVECHNAEDFADCAHRLWLLMQEKLSGRCKFVLGVRYDYDLTLAEVGKLLGVTPERVRQIEVLAIRKLRREPEVQEILAQWFPKKPIIQRTGYVDIEEEEASEQL